MNRLFKKSTRIIVIDLLYLGDLIFALPFIKGLRSNFPDGTIDLVVNSVFYDIMIDNPYLDNLFSYNKKWGIRESLSFARKLSHHKYNLGLNIHGNWRTALLLKLINPEYAIGYGGKGRGIFLDQELKQPKAQHMVDIYLDFLTEIGLSIEHTLPTMEVPVAARIGIAQLLEKWGIKDNERLIALNTGGTWPTKRWTAQGFAQLADRLNRSGVRVVFTGSCSDLWEIKKIVALMDSAAIIAAGQTSLKELIALLARCDLVISNDSGPVHVAAAVGTPTITIFGPSDEVKYRPLGEKHRIIKTGIECRPCGEHQCPLGHHRCMRDIKVEDIIGAVKELGVWHE
ncbi:MAG: lipopolysaccharide heptosyltransferase II [Halanaerobiales bacterium]|nr:lipopolysaccharide heptosyltransferase II [Halanaerobiales bacterium]